MANINKRFKKITKNGKHTKENERRIGKMLQDIRYFILEVLRKATGYYELKEENKKLDDLIYKQNILLKRISNECENGMQTNLSLAYSKFHKIKELANTFPNDN